MTAVLMASENLVIKKVAHVQLESEWAAHYAKKTGNAEYLHLR